MVSFLRGTYAHMALFLSGDLLRSKSLAGLALLVAMMDVFERLVRLCRLHVNKRRELVSRAGHELAFKYYTQTDCWERC